MFGAGAGPIVTFKALRQTARTARICIHVSCAVPIRRERQLSGSGKSELIDDARTNRIVRIRRAEFRTIRSICSAEIGHELRTLTGGWYDNWWRRCVASVAID